LKYSREWALRAVHEASLHDENCSVSLTYDPQYLPPRGSLDPVSCVLFLKRLRKSIEPKKVRHMYAGEYGDDNGRPHYHFLLFGHSFDDLVEMGKSQKGFPLFRSAALSKLWPFGLSNVGSMSFEAAAYIARYVMKKRTGVDCKKYNVDGDTGEMVEIVPEFFRMSRGGRGGHGIGYDWFKRFADEVYLHDSCVVRGSEMKPPRYYDEQMKLRDAAVLEVCKARRLRKYGEKVLKDGCKEVWRERAARELIAVANLKLLERSL
jgi:hypothetical protein